MCLCLATVCLFSVYRVFHPTRKSSRRRDHEQMADDEFLAFQAELNQLEAPSTAVVGPRAPQVITAAPQGPSKVTREPGLPLPTMGRARLPVSQWPKPDQLVAHIQQDYPAHAMPELVRYRRQSARGTTPSQMTPLRPTAHPPARARTPARARPPTTRAHPPIHPPARPPPTRPNASILLTGRPPTHVPTRPCAGQAARLARGGRRVVREQQVRPVGERRRR